jgi:hypothetical protein
MHYLNDEGLKMHYLNDEGSKAHTKSVKDVVFRNLVVSKEWEPFLCSESC